LLWCENVSHERPKHCCGEKIEDADPDEKYGRKDRAFLRGWHRAQYTARFAIDAGQWSPLNIASAYSDKGRQGTLPPRYARHDHDRELACDLSLPAHVDGPMSAERSSSARLLDQLSGAVAERLVFAARYLAVATALNGAWEVAQLPLYTIWFQRPLRDSLLAAAHCTGGDLIIAALALVIAILAAGRAWPAENYLRVATAAVGLGIAYTIASEWVNVEIRGIWAYAPRMIRLPWIGTGLSPLAQWLVVPSVTFVLLRRGR